MHGPGATKPKQREIARIEPAMDRYLPYGAGHLRNGNPQDTVSQRDNISDA
jgi:hypothetical protein